ncbi:Zn finger in ubiquitin hydrolases putative Ubiquitin carboxyl terminal hydrolase UBA TS N domain [Trypanosoma vivax]|nr:Zn finger in ubiquitin hydrolases putative Ubiquitin carboxyl terminal hydrolase UBA TS N domain [Trypanosoma vivax]
MFVWIKELPPKEEEQPKDINKLGVLLPKEYESAICCSTCGLSFATATNIAGECYERIMQTTTAAVQGNAADSNGEYSRPQCPHLVCIEQEPFLSGTPPDSSSRCSFQNCECQTDNWMCMTCGAIGCPRAEVGGSGHALQHHHSTGHPAVVKIGTVTPSGADFYCYFCDDEVSDAHFEAHMKHFGIDVKTAKKTAKTLAELQYDYSSQFDFNRITESGESLVPVFGPGRTGMHNFGNACYMNSVLQCLFSLEAFQEAFYHNSETRHQRVCKDNPYNCRACQIERIASGLLSGEFSKEESEKTNGIRALEFKQVFAQKHPEFSTGSQQDAQEYFLFLLEEMRRHVMPVGDEAMSRSHPSDIFKMKMENRVECNACRKVRYTYETDCCLSLPIPQTVTEKMPSNTEKPTEDDIEANRPHSSLDACVELMMQRTDIECKCSACGNSVTYYKTTRVSTFPDVLAVYIRRAHFDIETMSVTKRDVFVDVPERINLEFMRGKGLQVNEEEMPSDERELRHKNVSMSKDAVDELALATLLSMGIEDRIARYALVQTGMNAERAIDYIFSRDSIEMEIECAAGGEVNSGAQGGNRSVLVDGPAAYQLHAMISHMGSSAKTGHYVCHIRDKETGKWVLFNDEKVAESRKPPFSMASLYFFKREKATS